MKKLIAICLALLLLAGCKPADEAPIRLGSEDGGGTGYGSVAGSTLTVQDFFSVVRGAPRADLWKLLGSPQYDFADDALNDQYTLSDGSRISLQYNKTTQTLFAATYTDAASGKTIDFFEKLVELGVLRDAGSNNTTPSSPSTPSAPSTEGGEMVDLPDDSPKFQKKSHDISIFEQSLSLYADRITILTIIGLPSGYASYNYQKDGYILDVYTLSDGRVLYLDYGYGRKTLRGATIKHLNGAKSVFLGAASPQGRPGDFARPEQTVSQFTALKAGMTAEEVYRTVGDPHWLEGSANNYRDAYRLMDGRIVYLSFSAGHATLSSVSVYGADGRWTALKLS